jgi:L-ascorbate metabolism protein UlaG (beta-lactamase superfamily)
MALNFTYLDHSGFLVETDHFYLIFDYFTDSPKPGKRTDGVICPTELLDKQVLVFVSHRHGDHFNPVIFEWADQIPFVSYVISDDVASPAKGLLVKPNQTDSVGNVLVETFRSTDEGVAFLVEVDGYRIYHAGDLNWWHWEGEEESYNRDMAKQYQKEINKLAGKTIDLAFVPVDPRLGSPAYLYGMDYLMRTVSVGRVVPMHFWKDYSVMNQMLEDSRTEPYRERICMLSHRGQTITVTE